MIASPVFFYTVSAHLKIFMDRSQSLWVKQYWIDGKQRKNQVSAKKTLLISAGATSGKKLFDGILMTMKYFLDVYDAEIWRSLLYRGLDFSGDAAARPDYLAEAREAGTDLANAARP
jgi:multimeric flavodoxin WrbA